MRFVCLSLWIALFWGLLSPAHALDFTVNSTEDVPDDLPGDGICRPVNAVGNTCTLRAAIMEANALGGGHTIFLTSGIGPYNLTRTGILEDQAFTGDLDIHASISIVNGTSNPPLINGRSIDRVFDVHPNGSLLLININVIGGYANAPNNVAGGGFRVAYGGRLFLTEVNVSANVANVGGAIYNDGRVQIDNSRFFNNVLVGGQLTPEDRNGAAIRSRGELFVLRSTLDFNGVIPGGGGQIIADRDVIWSSRGGSELNPLLVIANSTLHDNTRGVFVQGGVPTQILGSTLVNNGSMGLRFVHNLAQLNVVQLTMMRTVLFGHGSDCNQLPQSGSVAWAATSEFNASSDNLCGFSGAKGFQNISYPFNGGAGDHGGMTSTFMPKSFGILVDPPGSNCAGLTENFRKDQRGVTRPLDGNGDGVNRCDIGAVEFNRDTDPVLPDGMFSDRFQE